MQKVLRRNLLARNQAIKRQRRESEVKLSQAKRNSREDHDASHKRQCDLIKAELRTRREDWRLGPLAPNRVLGEDGGSYGMLDDQSVKASMVVERDREKYFNFAVNDRVVVVNGREKGKIGKVGEVDEESQTVVITDVNVVDVKVPRFLQEQNEAMGPYQAVPLPIHIRDVRLVAPLRDNITGKIKDTVVKHLRGGKPFVEPVYGTNTPKHTRYIAGLDIPVPWPKDERKDFQAETADTLAVDVNYRSFSPSVLFLPLPDSVVDEIRNKYSWRRTGHTQEYVQQKIREDAEEQWKKRRRMLLPQQEYWERQAKQKEARGKPEVTKETTDLIRNMQAATLGAPKQPRDRPVSTVS